MDRDTSRPEWVVEVLALDPERGEVIRVTVTGDQPRVTQGQPVRFEELEAIPWSNNGKSGWPTAPPRSSPLPRPAPPEPGRPARRACPPSGERPACRICPNRITHGRITLP